MGREVEHGPGAAPRDPPKARPYPAPQEWPAYRRDARRSGHTTATVPADLSVVWKAELGGRQSSPLSGDWQQNPFVRGPITAPVISELQDDLQRIGFAVEVTGVFDHRTRTAVDRVKGRFVLPRQPTVKADKFIANVKLDRETALTIKRVLAAIRKENDARRFVA